MVNYTNALDQTPERMLDLFYSNISPKSRDRLCKGYVFLLEGGGGGGGGIIQIP